MCDIRKQINLFIWESQSQVASRICQRRKHAEANPSVPIPNSRFRIFSHRPHLPLRLKHLFKQNALHLIPFLLINPIVFTNLHQHLFFVLVLPFDRSLCTHNNHRHRLHRPPPIRQPIIGRLTSWEHRYPLPPTKTTPTLLPIPTPNTAPLRLNLRPTIWITSRRNLICGATRRRSPLPTSGAIVSPFLFPPFNLHMRVCARLIYGFLWLIQWKRGNL